MKKINEGSWVSHFIVPASEESPSSATKAKTCKLESSNGQSSQQVFSQRVVPKNSDPRSFLIVTKSLLFDDMDPVYFDPELDAPYKACFNCLQINDRKNYKTRHNYFSCPEPKQREFCENCGRRDVDVSACPRCARGYREYAKRGFRGKFASFGRKFSGTTKGERKEVEWDELESEDDGFVFGHREFKNEIDEACGKIVVDEEEDEDYENIIVDEDYENIIVDEDEQTDKSSSTNETIQEFLSIMDRSKFLSIEDQSNAMLRFAKRQREHVGRNANKM